MSTSITFLHKRNEIETLSPKERKELLDQLIKSDVDLTEQEEKYLSKNEMKAYVGKKLQRAGGLTPYELKFTDDIEKDIYIMTDKRLELLLPILNSVDDSWRKKILTQAVFQNKGITDEIFNSLSDTDKKFYVNLATANSAYFSSLQLKFLTSKNQENIITQILGRGEDFSAEQIQSFTLENQKLYNKLKHKNIQESIRKIIKKIINEVVSDPGTVFGPYHDEITISKEKVKPQYFVVAINRAPKICSNPEISNQELSCPINYEIEKTIHSAERQFRHVNTTIEDEQINALINRGINKLVKLILQKTLVVGDKVHLKDKRSDLNVVIGIELEKEDNNETTLRFPIITVMNNKKFYTGFDTKGPVEI
jgi:hypothetical protein